MALRVTTDLPKFKELQKALNIPMCHTVGILEMLWHMTAKVSPRGDIGKHTNKQIADWIDWRGNADQLIDTLVKTGWVDKHPRHRLVIHDWHEHADKSVRAHLRNRKLTFVHDNNSHEGVNEELTQVPKKSSGNPNDSFGSPPGAGAGAGAGPGAGAVGSTPPPPPPPGDPAKADPNKIPAAKSPYPVLDLFPAGLHRPIIALAAEYQNRRYGGPNPNAPWYSDLLRDVGETLEVSDDVPGDVETLLVAIKSKPTATLTRGAHFKEIAEHCGVRKAKPRAREPTDFGAPFRPSHTTEDIRKVIGDRREPTARPRSYPAP